MTKPRPSTTQDAICEALSQNFGQLLGFGVILLVCLWGCVASLLQGSYVESLIAAFMGVIPALVLWRRTIPSIQTDFHRCLLPQEGVPGTAEILEVEFRRYGGDDGIEPRRYIQFTCRPINPSREDTLQVDLHDWKSYRNLVVGEELPILMSQRDPERAELRLSELEPWGSTRPRKMIQPPKAPAIPHCQEDDRHPFYRRYRFFLIPLVFLGIGASILAFGRSEVDSGPTIFGVIFLLVGLACALLLVFIDRKMAGGEVRMVELPCLAFIEALESFVDEPEDADYEALTQPRHMSVQCRFQFEGKTHRRVLVLEDCEAYAPLREQDQIPLLIPPGKPRKARIAAERLERNPMAPGTGSPS